MYYGLANLPGFMRSGTIVPVARGFLQGAVGAGAGSGAITVAFAANVTAGSLLTVHTQTLGALGTVPTDSLGTTYTEIDSYTATANRGGLYAGIAPSSGANTVTGKHAVNWSRICIAEYKGYSQTFEAHVKAYATNSQSITTITNNALIVASVGSYHGETYTAGAGFTIDVNGATSDAAMIMSGVKTPAGAQTVSYTSASYDNSVFFAAAFPADPNAVSPGAEGDYYINTVTKKIYGPRTNGVYTLIGTMT